MKYKGKLYGRVDGKYLPLLMSSEEVDKMHEALKAIASIDKPPQPKFMGKEFVKISLTADQVVDMMIELAKNALPKE